jgi:sterol desaturase/sphingolipid hydroxylase (fatty acid hydroxylase superfamily)
MTRDDTYWISSAAVMVAATIFIGLERKYPFNKGQKFLREGFFTDFVLYNLIQSFALGLLISKLIQLIDQHTQINRLSLVSSWDLPYQLLFFLITHDVYIYWFHRFQHSSKFFWRIHEAHHSTHNVDWLSGARSHVLEILINQTIEFAPMVLLGASPEVVIYKGTIDAIWGMYIHSNIDVHSGNLQFFINGPEMHRWHHSNGGDESLNKNFSTKFAIWDWIFRTAYFPRNKKPVLYGLNLGFPKNYFVQQLFAFRKF